MENVPKILSCLVEFSSDVFANMADMKWFLHVCFIHYALLYYTWTFLKVGFPDGSVVKKSACQCRRSGFDPWSGKSLGGGNGNPLQYSCLKNPLDRGARRATVRGVAKSWTGLSDWAYTSVRSQRIMWESVRQKVMFMSKSDWSAMSQYLVCTF